MSPAIAKLLFGVAVFVPYLTVSVIFFLKMAQTCGMASLAYTAAMWVLGSVLAYLAASKLSQDMEYVNDSDQFLCVLIAFVLWILFVLIERFIIVSFLGGACDVSVVIPLVVWVGGARLAAIVSEGIPLLFRN